jgi:hypothetical protein
MRALTSPLLAPRSCGSETCRTSSVQGGQEGKASDNGRWVDWLRSRSFVLAAAALLFASPAIAQSLSALQPLVLLYQACAFETPGGQEDVRSRCAPLRERLLNDDGDRVIASFFPRSRMEARRRLQNLFVDADRDAEDMRTRKDAYTREMISYLQCLGRKSLEDQNYRFGRSLVGARVVRACDDDYQRASGSLKGAKSDRKNREELAGIRRSFRMVRAFPNYDTGIGSVSLPVE